MAKLTIIVISLFAVMALAAAVYAAGKKGGPPPVSEEMRKDLEAWLKFLPKYAKTERDTLFWGRWMEGTTEGRRVGFQFRSAVIGEVDPDREQISGLYLHRLGPTEPLPSQMSPRRLERYLKGQAPALAARYILNGGDHWEMRLPEVQEGLLKLSDSVQDVALLINGGVKLWWRPDGLARERLEADVQVGIAILKAFENKKPI